MDWSGTSIAFGTRAGEVSKPYPRPRTGSELSKTHIRLLPTDVSYICIVQVLLLPRIKEIRSPHRLATAVEAAGVVAAAVHPGGGRILTLTASGVLQVWNSTP